MPLLSNVRTHFPLCSCVDPNRCKVVTHERLIKQHVSDIHHVSNTGKSHIVQDLSNMLVFVCPHCNMEFAQIESLRDHHRKMPSCGSESSHTPNAPYSVPRSRRNSTIPMRVSSAGPVDPDQASAVGSEHTASTPATTPEPSGKVKPFIARRRSTFTGKAPERPVVRQRRSQSLTCPYPE